MPINPCEMAAQQVMGYDGADLVSLRSLRVPRALGVRRAATYDCRASRKWLPATSLLSADSASLPSDVCTCAAVPSQPAFCVSLLTLQPASHILGLLDSAFMCRVRCNLTVIFPITPVPYRTTYVARSVHLCLSDKRIRILGHQPQGSCIALLQSCVEKP